MNRKMKKAVTAASAAAVLAFSSCPAVYASQISDGKITLDCGIQGMSWDIYRVAEACPDGSADYISELKNYRIPSFFRTGEELQSYAETVSGYIAAEKISPCGSGVTDESGMLCFADLEDGWYTAVPHRLALKNVVYMAQPLILCVSPDAAYSSAWGTEVSASPKISTSKPESFKDIVIKFFPDDTIHTPEERVTVIIFRDDEEYTTVELTRDNDWTYIIRDVPDDDTEWTVINSDAPEYVYPLYHRETNRTDDTSTETHYIWHMTSTNLPSGDPHITMSTDDSDFNNTVTETDSQDTPVTDTTSGTDSPVHTEINNSTDTGLPQTGQLWWPVPVLASAGFVLAAAGAVLRKKDGE